MRFLILFIIFFHHSSEGQEKSESFIIKMQDQKISVISPEKKRRLFSVIIENKSLANLVGKFAAGGKNIKFISVSPGKQEVVELENNLNEHVTFIPLSPAFQEVPLYFGKKAYEIPSR